MYCSPPMIRIGSVGASDTFSAGRASAFRRPTLSSIPTPALRRCIPSIRMTPRFASSGYPRRTPAAVDFVPSMRTMSLSFNSRIFMTSGSMRTIPRPASAGFASATRRNFSRPAAIFSVSPLACGPAARGDTLKMAAGREKFLRVAEAKPADAGRGIVRIDPEVMKILELKEGDIVLVEGAKSTAAGVRHGYPEDANRGVIRMDGMQRRNAGVGIDDKVGLRKALARPAEKVSLAPTEPIRIMGGEQYMAQVLQGRAITRGDVISVSVMGRKFDFVVTSFSPGADAVLVEAETEIKIAEKPMKEEEAKVPKVDYEDIGGLGSEVRKVREMIELPLRHPELFERLGVEAPKGVLLHGPPGTGKPLLAKAVASETNANFHSISGPEIMSKFYGQSEENLRDIFKQAEENAPSIIFIDELDSIAPKRDEVMGEVERRVVAQLLALMDGLATRGKVVVIGATNRPNALDPALRRPGRFDREIEIGVPDRDGRLEILQIHTRGMPLSKDVDLKELAGLTHGYVGADLAALSKEAAMRALRKVLPEIDLSSESIPADTLKKII